MTTAAARILSIPSTRTHSVYAQSMLNKAFMADADRYAQNEEPCLSEILTDPMVHTLMDSDGIGADSLHQTISTVQARLR